MNNAKRAGKNPLERFLSLFAEVKSGEGLTTLLFTLNVFLLLCAYYIIKPVREALILTEGTAEIKSYASAGQALLLLVAVPVYASLASRLPRRVLINSVTIFFMVCLGVFFVLGTLQVPLAIVFYLWVGIFNLMVVAQFWSFANDLHTAEAGKRLFAIVGFGASAGAVFGSTVVGKLIEQTGVYPPLLISAAVLAVGLGLTNWIETRESKRPAVDRTPSEPIPKGNAFRLVLKTPYLLGIALMILVLNWVNTTGEYLLGRVVAQAADAAVAAGGVSKGQFIGGFYADFFAVVNVVGLLVQLFLVSRIIKYLGVRTALLILPVIAFGGYALLAVFPVLSAVRWAKTAENSVDYSLQNTLRGILFLPTTREQKYKAKQAIDTFFVRAGDVLSAGLVFLGAELLALKTESFALVNLALVVVWIGLAVWVGRGFIRLTEAKEPRP